MTILFQFCRCGNPTRDDAPVCGIVLCLATDAYERAKIAAKAAPRAPENEKPEKEA